MIQDRYEIVQTGTSSCYTHSLSIHQVAAILAARRAFRKPFIRRFPAPPAAGFAIALAHAALLTHPYATPVPSTINRLISTNKMLLCLSRHEGEENVRRRRATSAQWGNRLSRLSCTRLLTQMSTVFAIQMCFHLFAMR